MSVPARRRRGPALSATTGSRTDPWRSCLDAVTGIRSVHAGPDEPPVVLVHGIGAAGPVVAPLGEVLAARFGVAVPDLPGFGRSPGGHRGTDPTSLAGALADWCDALEVEQAPFVGVSAGCQVLLHLAVERPDLVDRLVLVGPTVDHRSRNVPSQLLRLALDALLERPSLWLVQLRGIRQLGVRRLRQAAAALIEDRPEQLLAQVTCPVLVVRGGWDPLVPARWARTAARLAPRGRAVTVPRAPHALVHSRPRQLARVVVPFLTAQP